MTKHLHIISLNVPYPVVHGAYFDIFYKLVALHHAGIGIHLHCFGSKTTAHETLIQYCESIHYYPRKTGFSSVSFSLPYIVRSRMHPALANTLLMDDHPIIMEGVHCSALLLDARFRTRKILLRLHNVEYKYYHQLFRHSHSLLPKLYYLIESKLLRKYEGRIAILPSVIAAVSAEDVHVYKDHLSAKTVFHLPVFTGFRFAAKSGQGSYCLYHGNLSVPENEKACTWLINEIFSKLDIPLIIAGRNPSARLINVCSSRENITLVANPNDARLDQLIADAQCNLCPSFNSTGIKLKLIHALYQGRHCIVNAEAVKGTGLASLVTEANDTDAFRLAVVRNFSLPFSNELIAGRQAFLANIFDKQKQANQIIQWLW